MGQSELGNLWAGIGTLTHSRQPSSSTNMKGLPGDVLWKKCS